MLKKSGLTLLELVIIIVVMGVISLIAVPLIGNTIEKSRLKADKISLASLNIATRYYKLDSDLSEIFPDHLDDEQKIELLIEKGFLSGYVLPQSNDGNFIWDDSLLSWLLVVDDQIVPLSPYGNTYQEITPKIIDDIQDYYNEMGRYGRTWGDYRYTDIGLDPNDWNEPILHVYYTPSGSSLFLKPESGYQFLVLNEENDLFVLKSSHNWNLIYSDIDGFWYFHEIDEAKRVDISTLTIQPF